jgi:hypothetical protein
MFNKKMILSLLTLAFVAIGVASATWAYLPSNQVDTPATIQLDPALLTSSSSFSITDAVPQSGALVTLGTGSYTTTKAAPGELYVKSVSVDSDLAQYLRIFANGRLIYDGPGSDSQAPVATGVGITNTASADVLYTYELVGSVNDQSGLGPAHISIGVEERIGL